MEMKSSLMSLEDTSHFLEKTTVGLTPLMLAARDHDLESCLELVKKGENAEARTKFGVSLLHFAALNKHDGINIIRHFIARAGLDIKSKDVDNEEPLHYAVRMADFERAKVLLLIRNNVGNILHFFVIKNDLKFASLVHQHNAELAREFDSKGRQAIHLAAECASPEMCMWLVKEARVDAKALSQNGSSVLHYAALNRRLSYSRKMTKFFLSQKVDKHCKNEYGETAMHAALFTEKLYLAFDLLDYNVDIKKCDDNILFFCVKNNKLESVKFVFNRFPALVKGIDEEGRNLLHVAAERANKEMCQFLASREVNPKALCSSRGSTLLHHVADNRKYGAELVGYFVELKLKLNKMQKSGETPLHCALKAENLEVAEELVRLGADLGVKYAGLNLLQYCIVFDVLKSAQLVHEKDKNLMTELGDEGANALHLAAANGSVQMCEWLCDSHFYPRSLSEERHNSVLHFVPFNELHGIPLVGFFVSKGVEINRRNITMQTPLHAALQRENVAVAKELIKFGANVDAKIHEDNLLHFCARRNKLVSAKFVVGIKPEFVNEKNFERVTAFKLASRWADIDFCKFLVEVGADTCDLDGVVRTALGLGGGEN